jgi:hypothetical protein
VLATYLIVAHGCHAGDHDDELAIVPCGERATKGTFSRDALAERVRGGADALR